MNTNHRKVGTAISGLIAGIITIVPAIGVDAAHRPSPDYKRPNPAADLADVNYRPSPDYKRPKPAVVTQSCPAADDVPLCNLDRASETVTTDASAMPLRSRATASGGGGGGSISGTRMTPSPR